jgi:hypothetical protein
MVVWILKGVAAMTEKGLAKVLPAHADTGRRDKVGRKVRPLRARSQIEEAEILRLAEQLKRALVPVQPSPRFVQNLLRQLVMNDEKEPTRSAHRYRRGVVIGAAAVGSALSVVGIVAYLLRNRFHMKARVASAR